MAFEQPKVNCDHACFNRKEKLFKEIFQVNLLHYETNYNIIPPGLYLAYFNRFLGFSWSFDVISDFEGLTDIEQEFYTIFESLSTYLSNHTINSARSISLLDIPVLGATFKEKPKVKNL